MAKGRITTTPSDAAKRWADNLGSSTTKIEQGVRAVQTAPGQRAAAQKAKYLQNVQARVDKWAQNTAAVSLGDWQSAMISKGLVRIGQGAQSAKPKVEAFQSQLLQHEQAGLSKINSMPNVTLQDSIARATAWMQHMAQFSYKK